MTNDHKDKPHECSVRGLVAFLNGEVTLDGYWFGGDAVPVVLGRKQPFWWRFHLGKVRQLADDYDAVRAERDTLSAQLSEAQARLAEIERQEPFAWFVVDASRTRYATVNSEGAALAYIEAKRVGTILHPMPVYAAPVHPAAVAVPDEVMRALYRMCTPLDDSWLGTASETAKADARCMALIRSYILSSAGAKREAVAVPNVNAMARALSDRHADACGVDKDDQWKVYSEDFIADVEAMLAASQQPASVPEADTEERWTEYAARRRAEIAADRASKKEG